MRRGSARTRFFVMVGVMLSYVAVLILLPLAIPFDVNATELSASLTPPGSEGHVLGCDSMGRDVLARTLAGGSESVLLGLAIMAVAVLVGLRGWVGSRIFGGAVDYVLSRSYHGISGHFPALCWRWPLRASWGKAQST